MLEQRLEFLFLFKITAVLIFSLKLINVTYDLYKLTRRLVNLAK